MAALCLSLAMAACASDRGRPNDLASGGAPPSAGPAAGSLPAGAARPSTVVVPPVGGSEDDGRAATGSGGPTGNQAGPTAGAATLEASTGSAAGGATREAPAGSAAGGATREASTGPTGSVGGSAAGRTIVVGSKDFSEQYLVAEMYARVLENVGLEVERRFDLGATPVAHEAIRTGAIDIYPEYTTTALLTVLGLPPIGDTTAMLTTLRREYADRFDLAWLEPSPFNNSQALATTRANATRLGLRTFGDVAVRAGRLRLGGPAEFAERPDGLPGLREAYGGFDFASFVPLGAGPERYDALLADRIDVVVAFTTDGRIARDQLVVLRDDRSFYPTYQVAPIVRRSVLVEHPGAAAALDRLAPLLTDQVMRLLNYMVDVEKRDYAEVAWEYLSASGLVPAAGP